MCVCLFYNLFPSALQIISSACIRKSSIRCCDSNSASQILKMPYVIVRQHPDELSPNGEEVPRTEVTGLTPDELRQVAQQLNLPNQLTIEAMIQDHKSGDTRYFNNSAAYVLNALETLLNYRAMGLVATGEKNDFLVWTMHKAPLLS